MKNKKIAIQTCFIDNYGACLQAYAIQQSVNEASGTQSHIIPFDRYEYFKEFLTLNDCIINFLKAIKNYGNFDFKLRRRMSRRFSKFRKRHLVFETRKFHRDFKYFYELNNDFDTFVCGSDVIWNPTFRKENLWFDMLRFAENDKKLVAYAPSFGISKFPEDMCEEVKEYLCRFNYLSCREDEGVDIIKNQFGLSAKHVLDPTLLLSKDEWHKFAKTSRIKAKKDYVVVYMFDDMPLDKIIKKILDESNYDIYLFPFGNINNYIFKNKRIHNACMASGPIEFVYLIENAKLVLANSLHALAFSINMNTPFVLFNRDNKDDEHSINSRLRSMTRMFKFESRIFSFDDFINEKIYNVLSLGFSAANEILETQRNESFNYLKEALADE